MKNVDLSLLAIDTITVCEVSFIEIVVVDLVALYAVVGALAEGVLQFAHELGFFSSES